MSYINEFLNLNCAGDVLKVIPKQHNYHKEITESWAMIRRIKSIVIDKKGYYFIRDLCAGNAFTSVLTAFMLPIYIAEAFDKKRRSGRYDDVRKFRYIEGDIYSNYFDCLSDRNIIISVHPCKTLAERIIEIYNNSDAPYLFLMPCCINPVGLDQFLVEEIDKYTAWCYHLRNMIKDSDEKMVRDKQILSPCNIIIKAERKG